MRSNQNSEQSLDRSSPILSDALGLPDDGYFRLPPDLDTAPRLEHTADGGAEVISNEPLRSPRPESEVDPWMFPQDSPLKAADLKTWESFDVPEIHLKPTAFITEAGTGAYDSFLASESNPCGIPSNGSYETLDPNAHSACLLAMSLGRDSVLFSWNSEKKTFQPSLPLTKVPGYSGESLSAIVPLCTSCGQASRRLRSFINKTYSSSASPPRVALANALDSMLLVIQDELGRRGLRSLSILQLQSLVRPVFRLLSYFYRLVMKIKRSNDADLLSLIYNEAQSAEISEPVLRDSMSQILRIVSTPWTEFVEEWIGLKPEEGTRVSKAGPGKGFVKVESNMWIDDQGFELEEPNYFLDSDNMPSFVPDDVAQVIFETGRNLRFLQESHPEHPMASSEVTSSMAVPRLEWQYDWESITRVEEKALEYQRAVLELLQQTRDGSENIERQPNNSVMTQDDKLLQVFGKDEQDLQQTVLASIASLDRPIETKETWNQLSEIIRRNLFDGHGKRASTTAAEFSPHWSLLPLLSFGPMVYAQARLINRECLGLLFSEHGLRKHLAVQRAFQLLGNGMFSSRLTNALFNPDMETTERRSGVSRSGVTMGLRLSSRENWPPASSELRLALMGVLTESYQQENGSDNDGLPGDLSFAIRDLSTEEMERCMDQGSLEALDFLRMSYKPPQALAPVITPASLVKYDRIFKLMLRVLRMLFVVDQLFRDLVLRTSHWANLDDVCVRFRVEAHHFVTNIARYFFDTGIDQPWRRFQTWLDKVEKGLQDSGLDKNTTIVSPKRLGEEHERTLNDIAQALLLRKRQQPVLKLLEEIFTQILRFAKQSRLLAPSDDASVEVKKLYKAFREKVEVFITVCRGMGEKAGSGNDREAGEGSQENALAILVLMLDMSNYYTKR